MKDLMRSDMKRNEAAKDNTENTFSPFDLSIGEFLSSVVTKNKDDVRLAASLISRQLSGGHVCVKLPEFAGRGLGTGDSADDPVRYPRLSAWLQSLENAECVGRPGEFKPMILDEAHRLYFQRYWQYEQDVAGFVRHSLSVGLEASMHDSARAIREKLQFYFPEMSVGRISWPGVAAAIALMRRFLIITGSPGTGKTTAMTRVMAFLQDVKECGLRIALCAPTGKAAARMEESIKKTKMTLSCPKNIKESIPDEAMTIHRLLGSRMYSPYFSFNEKNNLPYDLIVVDEASMVDLPLAAKLMTALRPEARLILLGDRDQLASVDAGSVLGDICFPESLNVFSATFGRKLESLCGVPLETSDGAPDVRDCIIEMRQNYRFSEGSGIGVLSRLIKAGDADRVLELTGEGKLSDVHLYESVDSDDSIERLRETALECYRAYLQTVVSGTGSIEDIFDRFEAFRVLCALRVGPWGSERLNRMIETLMAQAGLIRLSDPYYQGRPVMIVQNDYRLQLFNGDVGLVLRDSSDHDRFKVYFRDARQGFKKILPERLPRHETVWAMTVHKSQGSEFDDVILVLPENDSTVLTRELLYTGVTRARLNIRVWAGKNTVKKTIQKQIVRESGLTDAIKVPAKVI
ncbi:MAG: exodeoxyribonuclease V subunit alpha [Deltaproteobacteria bacterium]|nr:exodeoxyribonuclease V subunit alpha [Deltaproteobacteria bacterium]